MRRRWRLDSWAVSSWAVACALEIVLLLKQVIKQLVEKYATDDFDLGALKLS
jgi:hypothetical protein